MHGRTVGLVVGGLVAGYVGFGLVTYRALWEPQNTLALDPGFKAQARRRRRQRQHAGASADAWKVVPPR